VLPLSLPAYDGPLQVTAIGAHSDDIEIGCGGALRAWVQRGHRLHVNWVVLSADGPRGEEATQSAMQWLGTMAEVRIHLAGFRDSHFPAAFSALKEHLAYVRGMTKSDIVFTHGLEDRHQDHRLVAELTWQTWREHLILEYEIPKYEGDLTRSNAYVPIPQPIAEAKADHLMAYFGTQRGKDWFSRETFLSLMRLRGIECRAPDGFAEAFLARKIML
jgi:LmbE family N-acetylglucosaminyl deacetylase